MLSVTLSVVMALSWVPVATQTVPAPQQAEVKTATAEAAVITCPLTGEKISPCCCPAVKK